MSDKFSAHLTETFNSDKLNKFNLHKTFLLVGKNGQRSREPREI